MRDIKFRAFHKTWKKMYCVAGIHHIMEPDIDYHEPEMPITKEIQEVFLVDELPACEKVWWIPISEVELMEYIGRLDHHDIEMCEGDIIEYIDNTSRGLVKKITVIRDIRHLPDFSCSHWEEIIGNIWEHPELLEKENINGQ